MLYLGDGKKNNHLDGHDFIYAILRILFHIGHSSNYKDPYIS